MRIIRTTGDKAMACSLINALCAWRRKMGYGVDLETNYCREITEWLYGNATSTGIHGPLWLLSTNSVHVTQFDPWA